MPNEAFAWTHSYSPIWLIIRSEFGLGNEEVGAILIEALAVHIGMFCVSSEPVRRGMAGPHLGRARRVRVGAVDLIQRGKRGAGGVWPEADDFPDLCLARA
jgi:hypothetical protein